MKKVNYRLSKFKEYTKEYGFNTLDEIGIGINDYVITEDEWDERDYIGVYDIFNNELYAIFSFKNKNYLFLKDQLLEITDEIKVVTDVNWSLDEMSVFKVFKGEELVSSVEYKNVHEGILMPFDFEENWKDVNFGYRLGEWVDLAKERNHGLIFPNGAE